jgi:ribonuclease HI
LALIIHVDGGSRGNPGPAGAGVVIQAEDGTRILEAGYFLGEQTNNAAEYHALIRALERAQRCGDQPIAVRSDSELLVRQITGQYRVRNAKLAGLFEQVQLLLLKVGCWRVEYIPREQNRRADELANLAMDRGRDVIVYEVERDGPATPSGPSGSAPIPATTAPAATPSAGSGESATWEIEAPGSTGGNKVRAVRVAPVVSPGRSCPVGGCPSEPFTVSGTLPGGLCVYAAHAIVPTLLAIQNTEAQELTAVPTMTVRCMHDSCGAAFQLSPLRSQNGNPASAV